MSLLDASTSSRLRRELRSVAQALPADMWLANRHNLWRKNTSGACDGYVQANLAIVAQADAFDFLRFCQRNPQACPLLEVTDPGNPEPTLTSPGADLRTDVPRYRVYRDGVPTEDRDDILELWRDDLVSFLLGCSYSFEHSLKAAGLPIRHHEQNVAGAPMYITDRSCVPAGKFQGKLIVSMRPMPAADVARAVIITAARPDVHGAPVHIGSPASLGIPDLGRPDWGAPVALHPGDVPVFWACGVTSQQVAREARPELMITHATGFMFITGMTL